MAAPAVNANVIDPKVISEQHHDVGLFQRNCLGCHRAKQENKREEDAFHEEIVHYKALLWEAGHSYSTPATLPENRGRKAGACAHAKAEAAKRSLSITESSGAL